MIDGILCTLQLHVRAYIVHVRVHEHITDVYIGVFLGQLHYISANLGGGGGGGGTTSAGSATSTYAYIGTPPQLRRVSRLVWRQGACHMFEDVLAQGVITQLYQLGPNYVGSFQACGKSSWSDRRPCGSCSRRIK